MDKRVQTKSIISDAIRIEEVMQMTGWTRQRIYHLTSTNQIPHYKPMNKTLFFSKAEIEKWLLSNRQATVQELEEDATDYVNKKMAI